jgi:hypothetical protein
MHKTVWILVSIFVLLVTLPGLEWWRFAQFGSVDAKSGAYTNGHLDLWLAINGVMPAGLRSWACGRLLDREREIMGGRGAARAISADNMHNGDNWKRCTFVG